MSFWPFTYRQQDMLDLCIALAPVVDAEGIQLLHRVVVPLFQDKDVAIQKKAYNILRTLCQHHTEFVQANLQQLQTELIESVFTCAPPAKKVSLSFTL